MDKSRSGIKDFQRYPVSFLGFSGGLRKQFERSERSELHSVGYQERLWGLRGSQSYLFRGFWWLQRDFRGVSNSIWKIRLIGMVHSVSGNSERFGAFLG